MTWALILASVASGLFAAGGSAAAATRRVTHDMSPEAIIEGLWAAHREILEVARAREFDALHDVEEVLEEGFLALGGFVSSLPGPQQRRAEVLLDRGFELVDALHGASASADGVAAERTSVELERVIGLVASLFQPPDDQSVET